MRAMTAPADSWRRGPSTAPRYGKGKEGARDRLCDSISREERFVCHPTPHNDFGFRQRQHRVAAAEDLRSVPVEGIEVAKRLVADFGGDQWRQKKQGGEQTYRRNSSLPKGTADRGRSRHFSLSTSHGRRRKFQPFSNEAAINSDRSGFDITALH
jgi:hypothetical protein